MSMFDLDHIGIAVRDLAQGAEVLGRLGFTLTERSLHMATGAEGERRPAGTGNHCIILKRGYVELIAPTAPDYKGRLLPDLARYEGLHLVSFGTADAENAAAFLSDASGREVGSRRVTRPFRERGQDFEAGFDILDLPEGTIEEGHLFAIRHLTPEVIWQTPLMTHQNGAEELSSVAFCVENPGELASRVARLFDGRVDGNAVRLAAGMIEFHTSATFRDRFRGESPVSVPSVAALSLKVGDLANTIRVLDAGGIRGLLAENAVIVPRQDACGVVIEFIEGVTRP